MADSRTSFRILLCVLPSVLVLAVISLYPSKGTSWTLKSSSSSDANVDTAKASPLISESRDEPVGLKSASPPVALEALPVQLVIEADNDVSKSNSTGPPTNKSQDLPSSPSRPRARTNLDRLELRLQQARAAIKATENGSRLQDPDYIPGGAIYLNAKAFHGSYLEMEKQFKVFVYKEGDPPLFHYGPCFNLYSMEGIFISKMEINTHFRTHDPEKAHVFFLPYSVTMMISYIWKKGTRFDAIGSVIHDYVNLIAGKYHYFNRSLGADHFMLSCHDWGPITSFYGPHLVENSIRALCNANTSEHFNPKKDVSIPEIRLMTTKLDTLIGGPSPSQRSILAFFAGGNHGAVRPLLFNHWENKDANIQVHSYLPKNVSYQQLMRNSKFCLCPSGYEVASPRVVESVYNGCVPVLISKNYALPFSDVLNWKMFAVIVTLDEIPDLKKMLMSIPDRQYIRMQKRVVQVRRHFQINSPPKRFDVFHMILHSIWLRRLNIRIGNDHDSGNI